MNAPTKPPSYAKPLTPLALAMAYVMKHPGRKLFPCRGKSGPCIKDNLARASNDPAQLAAWAKEFAYPDLLWACSPKVSGIFCIDVDTGINKKTGKQKIGAKSWRVLREEVARADGVQLAETERNTTPSGGAHFIFEGVHKLSIGKLGRTPDLPPDQSSNLDCPNYFMIPEQGGYTVKNDIPAMKAPPRLQALVNPPRPPRNRTPSGDAIALDTFRKMLAATKYSGGPDGLNDRHTYGGWLSFMFAVHDAAAGNEGDYLEAFIDWSLNDPKQDDWTDPTSRDLIEYKWQTITDAELVPVTPITRASWIEYLKLTGNGALAAEAATKPTAAEEFAEAAEMPSSPEILASIKEGERQQAAEQAAGKLTWANVKDGFVYVGQQKQFVRLKDGEFWEVDAFEKQFGYVRFGLQDATGNRPRSFTKFIFDLRPGEGLETFDSFAFSPGQPPRYNGKFNQWRPSLIVPKQGDTKLWDAHLAYLFADAAARNRVLDWMAWVYQNPTLHPNHSLVVFGKIQGTGKTLLPRVLSKLLSALPITPVSQHTLESDHQTWPLRTKLAVVEIRSANAKLTNLLHELITGDTVHVDMKGLHDFDLPNVVAYWIETNKPNAMEGLDDSDRRHMIETTDGKVPLRPKTKAYYRMLYPAVLDNPEALAAIAYALKTRDLKDYSGLDRAPSTAAKKAMMAQAAGDVDKWMIEHRDNIPLSYTVVGVDEIFDAMPSDIKHVKGARRRIPEVLLSSVFNGEELGQVRLGGPDDIRPRLYVIHKTRPDVSVRETFTDAELARIHWSERRTGAQALAEAKADFADPPD